MPVTQHGDHRPLVATRGPAAGASRGLGDAAAGCSSRIRNSVARKATKITAPAREEGPADADQRRQRAADQRPDQVAGHDGGRQRAQRPAGALLRRLRRDQHGRARGIAAEQPGQQPQPDELPDVLRQCRSAPSPPPCRGSRGSASACARSGRRAGPTAARPSAALKKGRAIGDAGPLHDGRGIVHAELLDDRAAGTAAAASSPRWW